MPELPEVETIIRDLNKKIKDYQIVNFWSAWPKSIKGTSLKKFQTDIAGKRVQGVRRIGKNIFIDLSEGKTLYIHLKMTGHLLLKYQKNFQFPISNFQKKINPLSGGQISKPEEKDYFSDRVNQYIRHRWNLKKGKDILVMEFADLRKFGKIMLIDTDKIKELPEIKKLGIDAMDKKFNLKKFKELLNKKNKSMIGVILMDQSIIAGIGNIYRSEILFEAGVHPLRKIESLNSKEIELIFYYIKEILKKAIKMRGTSDSDYRDTAGKSGNFQNFLKVYRKVGEKCSTAQTLPKNKKCDNIVERIKVGQRSVFICAKCQK